MTPAGWHQASATSSQLEIPGGKFQFLEDLCLTVGIAKGSSARSLEYSCSFQARHTPCPFAAPEGSHLMGNKTLAG